MSPAVLDIQSPGRTFEDTSEQEHYLALAEKGLASREDHLHQIFKAYSERQDHRRKRKLPTIAFVGHGECGKDSSAEYLAKYSELEFTGGSTSIVAAPFMAAAHDIPPEGVEEYWSLRREHRDHWYKFCRALESLHPLLLVKAALSRGDILSGLRAVEEVRSAIPNIIEYFVWVDRKEAPVDHTLEFGTGFLFQTIPKNRFGWIDNNGSLDDLRYRTIAESVRLFRTNCFITF